MAENTDTSRNEVEIDLDKYMSLIDKLDEQEHLEKITSNIIESLSILIDKKLDLFSSTVNNN